MEPTKSDTYGDLPLTFSTFDQEVLRTVERAGSHADSNSPKIVIRHADMTLRSPVSRARARKDSGTLTLETDLSRLGKKHHLASLGRLCPSASPRAASASTTG